MERQPPSGRPASPSLASVLWSSTPVRRLAELARERSPLWSAIRIGLIYMVLAGLWIAFSDRALEALIADPARLTAWQTYKGWAFVLGSGALIITLIHREVRRSAESDVRFRSLVEQSLAGVYVIRDGRFLYVNPRLAEIFGYTQDEMVEMATVAEVVAPDDRELVRENLRKRVEGESQAVRYAFRGRRKDGGELHVEVFGRRIELQGEPAVIGVLLDRTEEKKLEARLRRAQRMEAIGQLTGAVAHDFNNLLTAIITPLEICLQELEEKAELREHLAEVRETAERAAALTRQLLAFSRKQLHRPAVLDADASLDRLEPMLSRLLPERVSVRVEPGDVEANVRIDPSALEQIIVNLSVNARDAMPEGGEVTIRTFEVDDVSAALKEVGESLRGPHVCLEVRDTGHGMDEETKRQVFEPFFTTKEKGTGLGLATVFGLTKKAGGVLEVESEPGEGAVFRVFLPAVYEPAEALQRDRRPASGPSGKERILVVEDDDRVRAVATMALERFGYEVFAAPGVESALQFAEEHDGAVDLLMTDVMLGDGTGPGMAEGFVAVRPGTKVLFMSGYSDEEALGEVENMEGAIFLEKPFTLETFTEKVEKALAGPALRVNERSA